MIARTLRDHRRVAEIAYDKIETALRDEVPSPLVSVMRAELRKDARKTFWFFPIVCAQRDARGF